MFRDVERRCAGPFNNFFCSGMWKGGARAHLIISYVQGCRKEVRGPGWKPESEFYQLRSNGSSLYRNHFYIFSLHVRTTHVTSDKLKIFFIA